MANINKLVKNKQFMWLGVIAVSAVTHLTTLDPLPNVALTVPSPDFIRSVAPGQ